MKKLFTIYCQNLGINFLQENQNKEHPSIDNPTNFFSVVSISVLAKACIHRRLNLNSNQI